MISITSTIVANNKMKIADKYYTIVCDDIRHELGNKLTLAGVYGEQIIIGTIPCILPKLCLAVFLHGVNPEFKGFDVNVKFPDGETKKLQHIAVDQQRPKKGKQDANVVIVISPFRVPCEGKAAFELSSGMQKKPEIIHKFDICKMETTPSEK